MLDRDTKKGGRRPHKGQQAMAEWVCVDVIEGESPSAEVTAFLDREWAGFLAEAFWGSGIETVSFDDEPLPPEPQPPKPPACGQDYALGRFHLVARAGADARGSEVVGVGSVAVDGGVATLQELIVGAEARGRGIGTRILAAFEEEARRRGCHKLVVRTLADTRQERFYRHRGFYPEARLRCDQFHRDWVLLARFLS
ncbi:MAG TPA: GNAT family N-acetyltransferase [Limnochordia bacterium]